MSAQKPAMPFDEQYTQGKSFLAVSNFSQLFKFKSANNDIELDMFINQLMRALNFDD